ncbi:MAG: tRNA uridine-5-carboxymethylaminomethyl(34) synthesis enzyme MnmG [Lentimicrobium sp.]|mgnify:CR=1 FL=1|jgi:tRNA uridine 5-carboxymethylaminomethyl modification enzyme|nr:tRNA uridine-5-carboxymethylaminomethyl(34) synthesis enzyme MnmG [Lentimicrobium sp.]MDD2529095.1 tRNA uridine-5-carboxymethylaminomethyl(34) synthesis enzyme MnmG [Lentimicrobiaceae bacterium]MDY0025356.1 tRNA uridine-5-carboxymethylaminomethyl(34) synthesis enzyme MnmG [Lentimicrobium sp.]HAH57046.1 tRNA uridine-5-carboxymethylaminomethyl(34) synthesis enzyme MnmG [Bacteroidales bacterium]
MFKEYDVIVVGAGHAGSEAAAAAANMGSSVLLITMNMTTIAQMSCNPAMGGIAKGQIVREIDAMGGYSGIVTDHTMIQFRMLNKSKGPAMWSPRAQSDRMRFSEKWRLMLEATPNIDFWQDTVIGLKVKDNSVKGVKTAMGHTIYSKTVILTNGTFLNGIIHVGTKQFGGGRMGDRSSQGITENLKALGFESARLKTGTPVRVDGRSIDFSRMDEQKGDAEPKRFSFTDTPLLQKQRSCFLTYTTQKTHDILREGFDESPMFAGRIEGRGPRYCPSIEDKIDRFSDKDHHQLFVEPEGWETVEYYINGFSSSLPEHIQFKALQTVAGFENARIFRPGYAIEYDYFPPYQLNYSLETRLIQNLFFAGQINGTTGYEEAGAQGIMAGINAHLKIKDSEPFVLKRSEAYIGVLIDDLITKGIDEPYRMFTSRAEYRILLRQDNADLRLTPISNALGLASDERLERVRAKEQAIEASIKFINNLSVSPDEINPHLEMANTAPITQKVKLTGVLLRPQLSINVLIDALPSLKEHFSSYGNIADEIWEEAEILIKYQGYIDKEKELADRLSKYDDMHLKADFDYHKLPSLSYEAREKLSRMRPSTIGQASRINGISPADISVLIIYLSK